MSSGHAKRRSVGALQAGLALVLIALAVPAAASAALAWGTSVHQLAADTCTFTGAGNQAAWASGTNWSCGHAPGSGDNVFVTGGKNPLVPAAGGQAGTLTVDTSSRIDLADGAALTVAGTATFGAATLGGAGTVSANVIQKAGTGLLVLDQGVTLTAAGSSTWTDGAICIQNAALLDVKAALTIAGAADGFNCNGGAGLVKIESTGSVSYLGGTETWSTPVDIDGLLDVQGGTLSLASSSPNTDSGELSVDAGAQLILGGGRTFGASASIGGGGQLVAASGTVVVPNGASLTPASLDLNGGAVELDGTAPATTLPSVTLDGGVLTGTRDLAVTSLTANSGSLSGAHTLSVTSFSKPTNGSVALDNGITFVPQSDVTWVGGTICVQNGATWNVNHTLDVQSGAGGLNCNGGNGLVRLNATGAVTYAGGTHTWFTPIDIDGLMSVQGGSLNLASSSPNTDSGTISVAASGQLVIGGARSFGAASSVSGAGQLVVASTATFPSGASLAPGSLDVEGTVTLDGASPSTTLASVTLDGGTLNGTRDLTVTSLTANSGSLAGAHTVSVTSFSKPTGGALSLDNGITFVPQNDVTWVGGTICVQNGAVWNINNALEVQSGAGGLNCNGGAGLVKLSQTGSISYDGGTQTWFTAIDLDGSLDVQGGSLDLASSSPNSDSGQLTVDGAGQLILGGSRTLSSAGSVGGAGQLLVAGGATATFPSGASLTAGSLDVQGTVELDGASPSTTLASVTLDGGTLNGTRDLTVTSLTANSGSLSGSHTLSAGSFSKPTNGALALDGGITFVPQSDVTWVAGTICVQGGAIWTINHALDVQAGAGGLNCNGGAGLVKLSQTGSISYDGGTQTWFTAMDLDGSLDVQAGSLDLASSSPNTDNGDISVATGSQLTLGGSRTFGSGASLGGPGQVVVAGGVTSTFPSGASLAPGSLDVQGAVELDGASPSTTLASVALDGGTLTGTRDLTVTSLTASSGAVSGAHALTVGSLTKATSGSLAVEGGITMLTQNDVTWADGPICVQSAAVLRIAHTITLPASGVSFNCNGGNGLVDVVGPNGKLQRAGAGTSTIFTPVHDAGAVVAGDGQTLTFAGGLEVESGGTTTVDGTLGGPVKLNGGTLAGIGNVDGDVNNAAGTVSPGHSPGVLTIGGSYTQAAGGTLSIDVDGTIAGSGFDQLAISGSATLAGTLAITRGSGFSPGHGVTFQFLTSASRTGQFATVTGSTIDTVHSFVVDYSAPSGARLVVNGSAPPTPGTPQVTGTVAVGQTVTCSEGTWAGSPTFTYQWLRDGVGIGSATSRSYAIVSADATHQLACRVTGTNQDGSADATSAAVTVPATTPAPPTPGTPQITGTVAVGQTVTCSEGSWTGSPTFAYQWLREGSSIGGATGRTYAIVAADATHQLSCRVTGTNGGGSAAATSAAVTVPAATPVPPTPGTPQVSGTVVVGQSVTCSEGGWTGSPSFAYQWLRDGASIGGATGRTYAIVAADATHQLSCRVTGTNTGGSASATSAAVTVPAVRPAPVSSPVISGTPAVGRTLTCVSGSFSGVPAPTIELAWLRDGFEVQLGSTYLVARADAGHVLTCRATATNSGGSASATSLPVTVPAQHPPLQGATPSEIATAFGLPSAAGCRSGVFVVRLHAPSGITVRHLEVLVDGKAVRVTKVGGYWIARIDTREIHGRSFLVSIRVSTGDKRTLHGSRVYKTCSHR